MVADMVAFVASQFTTSTWDVGAQELCSVVLILPKRILHASRLSRAGSRVIARIPEHPSRHRTRDTLAL